MKFYCAPNNEYTIQQSDKHLFTFINAVSEVVMKLMAKNAEQRYQSASDLVNDLQRCLYRLQSTGRVESLSLAREDFSDRFSFKFSHDRVQQAAYSMIADGKRPDTHLQIGRLFKQTAEAVDGLDEHILSNTWI